MKDFTKELTEFIEDNNLNATQAFRLATLLTQVRLEALSEGMDKGEQITKDAFGLNSNES